MLAKKIDWVNDSVKLMLLSSAFSPNQDTQQYQSDIEANEIAAGNGYTAGGIALSGKALTSYGASSATARANSTAYAVGDVVRPAVANGHVYICTTAGNSAAVEPTMGTVIGGTTADGTVTWTCYGTHVIKCSASNISVAASTISAAYGVIVDTAPGTAATNPLICWIDFGGTVSSQNGNYNVNWDARGVFWLDLAI